VFDGESGVYLGRARLGVMTFLAPDRVLRNSYGAKGLVRSSALEADVVSEQVIGGKFPELVAVSLDRKHIIVLEKDFAASSSQQALVVRNLVDGTEEMRLPITETVLAVGFAHDGQPLVATELGLFAPRNGGLAPRRAGKLRGCAISADGTRAILTSRDGSRSLVRLPAGKVVQALPSASGEASVTADGALASRGKTVALVTQKGLEILDLEHPESIALLPSIDGIRHLSFGRDDGELLVDTDGQVHVLRRGLMPQPDPAVTYEPRLPPDFKSPERRGGELSFDHFEKSTEMAPPNLVARYFSAKQDATVNVDWFEPGEFDAGGADLERWKALILAREGIESNQVIARVWQIESGRVVEFADFRRDGCDPMDHYVRYAERDRVVLRMELTVPPGTPLTRVRPLLKEFFDEPTGAPPAKRQLASPRVFHSKGC
jgi:hypothetical protein